ncbi:MAG: DUF4126 domain-containing protein [bacterium]|nr:DUF4126 domain-containing protein [bacterium]
MDLTGFEWLTALALGLGLAAATGFRVFVPLLLAALAARTGHLPLAEGFLWLESDVALVIFALAAALEIAAYFIPWFDHLLDVAAQPAAMVAGALLMAATMVDMPPWVRWTVAVIVGGGTAGLVQGATGVLRLGSTATTGGLANPVFATFETGAATGLTVLAVALPLVALAVVAFLASRAVRSLLKWRGRKAAG